MKPECPRAPLTAGELQEVSSKLVEKDLVAVEVLGLRRALSARAGEAHLLGQQRVMLQQALERHKLEHLVQPTHPHSLPCLTYLPCSPPAIHMLFSCSEIFPILTRQSPFLCHELG